MKSVTFAALAQPFHDSVSSTKIIEEEDTHGASIQDVFPE